MPRCRFRELRADFTDHLHSIEVPPSRAGVGSHIGVPLLRGRSAVDARGPEGKSGRGPAEERFLTYCMSLSDEKWLAGPEAILYNKEIRRALATQPG